MAFDAESIRDSIINGFDDLIKDELQTAIEDHMGDQPWSVECSYCHKTLNVSMSQVDSSGDLSIRVDPCDCQKDE